MAAGWDLTALLNAADPAAPRAERHLWAARLLEWLRHTSRKGSGRPGAAPAEPSAPAASAAGATPTPVLRLRQLCTVLEQHELHRAAVQGVLAGIAGGADAVSLFADFGFAARASFTSELMARLRGHLLPGTPDTRNLAELFALLFEGADAAWIEQIDDTTLSRIAALWPAQGWRDAMIDAIAFLCSAVRAAGFGSALRLRMSPEALANDPFMQLAAAADRLRAVVREPDAAAWQREANFLRALLDACRRAADSVATHLEEYGVSLHIVFEADQLRQRTERIELVLDTVLAAGDGAAPAQARRLLHALVVIQAERRSVRALFAQHGTQLARQVAERSAETGEHYIARSRDEYRAMLRAAAGGGAVVALTTFAKFALMALGLSAFWGGFWAGTNYASSFIVIMLMHWTLATKQPAMTAPALAAKLAHVRADMADDAAGAVGGGLEGAEARHRADTDSAVEAFVDEVAHLIRSQVAGIVGNLAMCVPLVLLIQWLAQVVWGSPLVGRAEAQYVLESITLLGPTALFAAFTGVLLFASSLIAGWVENWFVLHRIDSAIEWNPRIVARLGAARARRWAAWWRLHISSVAANVSLGMMLGLVPVLIDFVGPPIEARHVTLSSGQLAAALGALGWPALQASQFWWCVAGIAVTGVLNLGVSFWLAFKVALRARGVHVRERTYIARAIRRRMWRRPLSFVLPPPRDWPAS